MNFSELPPSKQWAALKYRGEKFAEVWFKPNGELFSLTLRIPQENFQIPGLGQQLTMDNLLKAMAIAPQEVESWRYGDVSPSSADAGSVDVNKALPPPPQNVGHLDIHVRLKPPPQEVAPLAPEAIGAEDGNRTATLSSGGTGEAEISTAKWQDLDARWKAILAVEASIESLRVSMESLVNEIENSLKRTLTIEEKSYASRADVSQWERAKQRVHFALPRMKEFVHRATWALASPERKRLGEVYKQHIQPQVRFPRMDHLLQQLEDLQKDRQVLAALGKTVYQDSRHVSADIQNALKALQTGAETQRRKAAAATKNRFFK